MAAIESEYIKNAPPIFRIPNEPDGAAPGFHCLRPRSENGRQLLD